MPSLLDQIVKERIIPKALKLIPALKLCDDIDAIVH